MLKRNHAVSGLFSVFVSIFLINICFGEVQGDLVDAEGFREAGRFDQAETIYNSIISADANSDEAFASQEGLAVIYVAMGKQTEADTAYQELLAKYSNRTGIANAVDHVADAYREIANFQKARQCYQYIADQWPDADHAAEAQAGVVRASILMRDKIGAQAAMNKLLSSFASSTHVAKAVDNVADEYRKAGQYENARQWHKYVVDHWPQDEHAIEAQKGVVISNIILGDQTAAQAAADKLLSDFSSNTEKIAAAIDNVADAYEDEDNYNKAFEYYEMVLDRWPNSKRTIGTFITLAKLKMKIGDDAGALVVLQRLETAFPKSKEVREEFGDVAGEYEDDFEYDAAKSIYTRVKAIADSSSDEDATADSAKARLALATIERILSKIQRNDDNNLDSEIASLVADYQGNGDLPKRLHSIARRFGKCIRYEEAGAVYQRILRDYPDTEYGSEAVLGAPRMKISALIDGGEEDKAQGEIAKLMSEQASMPDLGDTLYFLARRFERAKKCSINRYSKAIAIHQHVINNWPGSRDASRARLDILKDQLLIAIETGNDSSVISELDQLMASNKGAGHLKHTVSRIAEQYFKNAQQYDLQHDSEKAKAYYEKAVVVWEKFFGSNFKKNSYTPEAYYWAAMCHQKLENYQQSIYYCQKIVDDHPDYRLAGNGLFLIGHNSEKLKESGALSGSQADLKTKTAYEQLLEKYPGSQHAQYARNWLNQYNPN